MKNEVNRTNNCTVHFMVNEEEMKELNRRFELSGYRSKREFYRDAIFRNKIINLDMSKHFSKDLRKYAEIIQRSANNINQIAKKVNAGGNVSNFELASIKKLVIEEINMLLEMRTLFSNYVVNNIVNESIENGSYKNTSH